MSEKNKSRDRRRHLHYEQTLPVVQESSAADDGQTSDIVLDLASEIPEHRRSRQSSSHETMHRRHQKQPHNSSSEEEETGLAGWAQNNAIPKQHVVRRVRHDKEGECDVVTDGCLCFLLAVLCFVLVAAVVYIFYKHPHDADHDVPSILHELGNEVIKSASTSET